MITAFIVIPEGLIKAPEWKRTFLTRLHAGIAVNTKCEVTCASLHGIPVYGVRLTYDEKFHKAIEEEMDSLMEWNHGWRLGEVL